MQYVGLAVEQTERFIERVRDMLGDADDENGETAESLKV